MINIVAKPAVGLNGNVERLPFYLAVEEWVAKSLPAAEYFFTWRVKPTVIYGRNQDPTKELDLEYCREHGVDVCRRRSGGGCVFADMNNLMLSYITPSTDVTTTFTHYTGMVAEMLRGLGLNAEANGRNDVLIDGAKVSGNAFYHLPGRSIVHGTLLYDVDIDTMSHAITPSRSKLESKGVQSVGSRVTSISAHIKDLSLANLESHIVSYFTDQQYVLTVSDVQEIRALEERYYDIKWLFGRRGLLGTPNSRKRVMRRVDGVGELDILIHLDSCRIADIEMTGDYFLLSDLDTMLFDKIIGSQPTRKALTAALSDTDVSKVVAGLSTDKFIDLISL